MTIGSFSVCSTLWIAWPIGPGVKPDDTLDSGRINTLSSRALRAKLPRLNRSNGSGLRVGAARLA